MEELYVESTEFKGKDFSEKPLPKGTYEDCQFVDCNFSDSILAHSSFIDCEFTSCNMTMVSLMSTALKEVAFYERQEKRNAIKLEKNPDATIKVRKYTGNPTFFDQIFFEFL